MFPEHEVVTIGQHRLLCGDVNEGAVDALMGEERADVVYCDPPWGSTILLAFERMRAGKDLTAPRLPWEEFLEGFAQQIADHRKPEAPVFIEMGTRWTPDLDEAMEAVDLSLVWRWQVTYGSPGRPRPSTVALYGAEVDGIVMPTPPHGEAVTRAILEATVRPGMVVLDPCTGLGMTARITHRLGGRFRGTELVPGRMEKTAAWLRRHA